MGTITHRRGDDPFRTCTRQTLKDLLTLDEYGIPQDTLVVPIRGINVCVRVHGYEDVSERQRF